MMTLLFEPIIADEDEGIRNPVTLSVAVAEYWVKLP